MSSYVFIYCLKFDTLTLILFIKTISLACYRALDAVGMSWDNMHLKNILSSDSYCSHVPDSSLISGSFNSLGQPLWHGKYLLITKVGI